MDQETSAKSRTAPARTMAALTFVFSQFMALTTLSATAVLTVNLLSCSCLHDHMLHKTYMLIVIYSEIPLCFFCAFIAEQLFRSSPAFLAIVFVLLKTIGRLMCVSYIAYSSHFWTESAISMLAAIAGSYLAFLNLQPSDRDRPVNPGWALIAGTVIPTFAWLITLSTATLR
jgi:hypothetical protein